MNKKVQKIIFAAMALSAMVPAGIGLSAVVPFGGNTQVVEAAADQNNREIVIHKYDGLTTNPPKDAGTGEKITDPHYFDGRNPVANVQFTIKKIKPAVGLKWADVDPKVDSTYQEDTTFTATSQNTNSAGTATFTLGTDTTFDGYYLVTENDSKSVQTPADPFIVQIPTTVENKTTPNNPTVLYSVNVYPKNELIDTNTDLNLNKLVDGKKFKGASAGQTIPWQLSVNVPKDIVSNSVNASVFEIHDTVNANLENITEPVVKAGTDTLTATTDYTATITGNQLDIVFTDAGKTKLGTHTADQVTVDYNADVKKTFETGRIDNVFSVNYTAPSGVKYDQALKPEKAGDPNTPNTNNGKGNKTTPATYTGGFDILKTDENAHPLAGAEFVILVDGKTVKKDGNKVILPNDAGYADKLDDYTVTTGADGKAQFVGLGLSDIDADTGNDVSRTYTLKEIKAPDNYSMIAKTIDVKVDLSTLKNDTPEATIVNEKKFILPLTGGNGYMVLIVIAAAAGIMLFVAKRKKDEEEEKTETK
ncbi:MAG: SpaH/EbpB family LPXTG-anchored major pilin [Enterococcaceae bacterium]|nr:SpaH/EbpB family LPXTG-anchored major pilin [Enterococcaceae bacterium]MCI1918628.1 SpaH/EbpB family LPXTG-anchored major pilin [Enterococcaceae bacterium]